MKVSGRQTGSLLAAYRVDVLMYMYIQVYKYIYIYIYENNVPLRGSERERQGTQCSAGSCTCARVLDRVQSATGVSQLAKVRRELERGLAQFSRHLIEMDSMSPVFIPVLLLSSPPMVKEHQVPLRKPCFLAFGSLCQMNRFNLVIGNPGIST